MSNSTSSTSTGISTSGLLGVAFIILKLCHVIEWSWWFVTLPFWWPLGVLLAFIAGVLAVCFISIVFGVIVLVICAIIGAFVD